MKNFKASTVRTTYKVSFEHRDRQLEVEVTFTPRVGKRWDTDLKFLTDLDFTMTLDEEERIKNVLHSIFMSKEKYLDDSCFN